MVHCRPCSGKGRETRELGDGGPVLIGGPRVLAKSIFLGFFLLLIVAVYSLRPDYIYRGAPSRSRWRDLRLWALILVLLHAYVYWQF